jgi:hypothetical protein
MPRRDTVRILMVGDGKSGVWIARWKLDPELYLC